MQSRADVKDPRLDGRSELERLLKASRYGSIPQAVASLAIFSHPSTVQQCSGSAVFRIVRGKASSERGQETTASDGLPAMLDDNTGPTDTFLWSNGIGRNACCDVQFCHLWQRSSDPRCYTNLANICILPSFLAKLSDTHEEVVRLLRLRAFELYAWKPNDAQTPDTADGLGVTWAECLPPTGDLATSLRSALLHNPKSRTTASARQFGWLFSDWKLDSSLS
jgi:hypothetical protein